MIILNRVFDQNLGGYLANLSYDKFGNCINLISVSGYLISLVRYHMSTYHVSLI